MVRLSREIGGSEKIEKPKNVESVKPSRGLDAPLNTYALHCIKSAVLCCCFHRETTVFVLRSSHVGRGFVHGLGRHRFLK